MPAHTTAGHHDDPAADTTASHTTAHAAPTHWATIPCLYQSRPLRCTTVLWDAVLDW